MSFKVGDRVVFGLEGILDTKIEEIVYMGKDLVVTKNQNGKEVAHGTLFFYFHARLYRGENLIIEKHQYDYQLDN